MENEKENQLAETFIKTQVKIASQKYKEYHVNNPTADKETIFVVGYCIGGFEYILHILSYIKTERCG